MTPRARCRRARFGASVFLGTPALAVPPLRALVAAGIEVPLVVTQPDRRRGRGSAVSPSPVKAAALELGLPVTDTRRRRRSTSTPSSAWWWPSAGSSSRHVLAALPMVNLHFSLLPRWRGAAPVERAILAGDERTGVDLMVVEEGLDTGGHPPARGAGHRPGRDARGAAGAAGRPRAPTLLVDALRDGPRRRRPRRSASPPTPPRSTPRSCTSTGRAPAVDVHRRVRLGGAWTTHHGKRLKVWRTHVPPRGDGPAVAAGDGPVELVEVQPEGKGRMPAADWANGAHWQPADGLGS